MWKWAVKRKKNKQGGWWEDGGGKKGIWGKEVNWEHQITMDSTNIFTCHYVFSISWFRGIVSWKEFEKVLERGMSASGDWKEKSVWISSSLACRPENNTWQAWPLEVCHTLKYPVPVIYRNTTSHIRFKALVVYFPEKRWPMALQMASGSPGPPALWVPGWLCAASWLGASLGWAHMGWEKGAEQP